MSIEMQNTPWLTEEVDRVVDSIRADDLDAVDIAVERAVQRGLANLETLIERAVERAVAAALKDRKE
jgi:hypothetical protein